jgi:hypothetical protein
MAVDEGRRHQMYVRLEEVLGPDHANTLMEYLPPVGWADVARKSDIEDLCRDMSRTALKSDVAALRQEMVLLEHRLEAKLESKLNSQTKTLVTLMSAQVLAVAALAFGAARLA